jgi:shikimate kinase
MLKDNLYLIGLSGAGKSTLGRLAAERLGRPYTDLDDVIRAWEGTGIPEIFEIKGEPYFRRKEAEALAWAARKRRWVFATGGGIVTREDNIALMRASGWVVFLDRPVEQILTDIDVTGRPLLQGDKGRLYALREARLALYQKAGDLWIKNDAGEAEAVDTILVWLREKEADAGRNR